VSARFLTFKAKEAVGSNAEWKICFMSGKIKFLDNPSANRRWLLQSSDRAGSTTVNLTQEFLAEMLGVRRTSVTEVASKIQTFGAIHYSRGVIKILDRLALEKMSCECYQTLLDQSVAIS
jgi:Crp-like helix-turn-helix domain